MHSWSPVTTFACKISKAVILTRCIYLKDNIYREFFSQFFRVMVDFMEIDTRKVSFNGSFANVHAHNIWNLNSIL